MGNGAATEATMCKTATADTSVPVDVNNLHFQYSIMDKKMVVNDLTLQLEKGSRCLLVGSNGAGKTTLLNLLGGKHMHAENSVKILGQPAFSNTHPAITVLSGQWARGLGLTDDVSVTQLLKSMKDDPRYTIDEVHEARIQELLEILDINLNWRLHMVSDGQRRRVQILMALVKPFEVLLLDEVTVDLDVVGRSDLLEYLRKETEERGATILYATHIFDGLDEWATHLAHMSHGKLKKVAPLDQHEDLVQLNASGSTAPLLDVVDSWLRAEREMLHEERKAKKAKGEEASKDLKLREARSKHDPFARNRMYNYW